MGGEWWVWHDLGMEYTWLFGYICGHEFGMNEKIYSLRWMSLTWFGYATCMVGSMVWEWWVGMDLTWNTSEGWL